MSFKTHHSPFKILHLLPVLIAAFALIGLFPPSQQASATEDVNEDPNAINNDLTECCDCFSLSVSALNPAGDKAEESKAGKLTVKANENGDDMTLSGTVTCAKDEPKCEGVEIYVYAWDNDSKLVATKGSYKYVSEEKYIFEMTIKFKKENAPYKIGLSCKAPFESPSDVCKEIELITGGCTSCESATCDDSTGISDSSNSPEIAISSGSVASGDVTGISLFYRPDTLTNPGPSVCRLRAPDSQRVTCGKAANGDISSVTTGNMHCGITATPTTTDPNAFEIRKRVSPTAPVFRTTRIENVTVNSQQVLRISSTFKGKTSKSEYRQPTPEITELITGISDDTPAGLIKETLTITDDGSIRTDHRILTDIPSGAITSDTLTTYTYYPWGREMTSRTIDPSGTPLTTTWDYYEPGELTGLSGGTLGYGKLQSITRPDGSEETHLYDLHKHTILRPFTGNDAQLVETRLYHPQSKTLTVTRTLNGNPNNTISKVVTIEESDTVTKTQVFTDATQFLETITETYPAGQDFGGQTKKTTRPDGTVALYSYSRSGNTKTTTSHIGSPGGSNITKGTKTTSIANQSGKTTTTTTWSVDSAVPTSHGIILNQSAVTQADEFGRPEITSYFNGLYTTSNEYGCCGLVKSTDRAGISTHYAHDALKRTIKTNRLGITSETRYLGLTTSTYRYLETGSEAEVATVLPGTAANEVSRSVRNLSGTHSEQWSRTAKDGALVKSSWSDITYNLGNGISRRTVATVPATATETADPTQTTETYLDGRTYQSFGDLSPHTRMSYTVGTTGVETTRSIMEGTNARESVTSKTDLAGRATSTIYADGATSSVTYNPIGQMVKSTDPDSVITLFAYNTQGQRTTTALDLNANGAIDYSTDQVTSSETNPTTAHGTTVIRSISKIWKPSDSGVNGGTVVSYSDRAIDGLSSWSTQFPNGANLTSSSETTLLGSGNATRKSTSPTGAYTLQTTTAGRLEKTQLFDSSTPGLQVSQTLHSYDSLNRPTHIKDSRHTTASITNYVSIASDAVDSVTDAAGNTTSFTYDLRNRRLTTDAPDTLDAAGATLANITTTSYFPSGQTKETAGAQTYQRSYTYDYANRMKTLTTYGGTTAITEWVYDNQRGWLTEKNYAGESGSGPGNTADYTYTAAGRLGTRTWERGVTTTYDYDSAGRQDKITYSDSTPQVDYIYDRLSRPTFVIQGAQVAGFTVNVNEYQYDTATLALTKEIIVEGAYDNNATSTQYTSTQAFKRTLDRTQDGFLRPETLTASLNGTAEHSVAYSYDTASRLGTVTHGTDTFTYGYEPTTYGLVKTVTGPAHTVTNSYEANRNVLTQKENKFGTTNLATVSYQTNAIVQRTNATHSGSNNNGAATRAFGYNSTGEVVNSATDTATYDRYFDFDGIGNRNESRTGTATNTGGTATSYTADAKNHYTAIGSLSPVHDADGNMTSGPLPVAPSANATLTWDAENRLASTTVSGTTTNYQYDYLSRRISKTTTAVTTRFVYDGWNMITEYAGSALKRSYTWGMDLSGRMQGAGGVGGLLAIHEASGNGSVKAGQTLYPTFDGNGNITRIIDSSSNVVCSYAYDPFGNFENPAGNDADSSGYDVEQPFAFSTKYRDTETGLYYYGYRYYDPTTGRWPSRDPIAERGGMNLYGFVGNNPMKYFDLLGLASVQINTDCGKKFDECNPTSAEIKDFLQSLPKGCKITDMEVNGHGTTSSVQINEDEDLEFMTEIDADGNEIRNIIYGDNDFSDDFGPYLDGDSTISLDGCFTGCTWSIFTDSDHNLAKTLSEEVPADVSGFKGVGAGDQWFGLGELERSVGRDRWYSNGNEK